MFNIIGKKNYYFIFSGALFVLSVIALFLWGLRIGIDFVGGSSLEVEFANANRPDSQEVTEALKDFNLGEIIVQPVAEQDMILKLKSIDEETHQKILEKLRGLIKTESAVQQNKDSQTLASANQKPELIEKQFTSIGPTIGKELTRKTIWALILANILITIYIAFSFRKVSKPVPSWQYGVAAVLALIHDVIITLGVFAFLGHFFNIEIDASFIAAILTVIGFSVHDSIVVFDRTRENLIKTVQQFEETVNFSVNQTLGRSISTSMTAIIAVLAIYLFGGQSTKLISLALVIGIFFGTYSSIFLASPLLVVWQKLSQKRR
ncbi:MAG: protein translocase subunit SecF [bacterium]